MKMQENTLKPIQPEDFISDGKRRIVIESVTPQIDCGAFPIKRIVGDSVTVEADIFADGHDVLKAVLHYRHEDWKDWEELPLSGPDNDRWRGSFPLTELGLYYYSVEGWVDRFATWRRGFEKKHSAGVDTKVDQEMGAEIIRIACPNIPSISQRERCKTLLDRLDSAAAGSDEKAELLLSEDIKVLMDTYGPRLNAYRWKEERSVRVDPKRAEFSSWYELFPRSTGKGKKHGSFRDCASFLSHVADRGFNVVYFPPIHPIGSSFRKGKNNSLTTGKKDPGSPWAIGSKDGGHKAFHPDLGTEEDFAFLVSEAEKLGLQVALDIAFQCSPDHPYVKEHPEWFVIRPDGSIQYAENPPKKYEDIYPINFESSDWRGLWKELLSVFFFWIERGVTIFRVDNPHTKSLYFWEWVIGEIKKKHREVIFLAEAFTKPKLMYRLAKAGFSQSYTYFTWRNDPASLREYVEELTKGEPREFFRPNFWPNTPDILHEYLQKGGKPAFLVRLILAATLSSNYGVYGPAFELLQRTPREEGSEEYINSEKYEIKDWKLKSSPGISEAIRKVNQIRNNNACLQSNGSIGFHSCDNEQILCYSKTSREKTNTILVTVNFDTTHTQSGWVEFSPAAVGLPDRRPFVVRDLLTDIRYTWKEYWNYIQLDPFNNPAHILLLEGAPVEKPSMEKLLMEKPPMGKEPSVNKATEKRTHHA